MSERYFITEEILYEMVMVEGTGHSIACRLLELARVGDIDLCLCTAVLSDAMGTLSEYMGTEAAEGFLRAAMNGFEVHPLTEAVSMQALTLAALADARFTDAATIVCAESCGADGIIVNDPALFAAADIKIIPLNSLR